MTKEEKAKQEFDELTDHFGKTVEACIDRETGEIDWIRLDMSIAYLKGRIKTISSHLPVNLPEPKVTPP